MPEPSILFTVTGVVVVSLAAWLAIVLKKANEPWGRTANADMVIAKEADPPIEPVVEAAPKSEPEVEAVKSEPKVETSPKSEPKVEAVKSEPKTETAKADESDDNKKSDA